MSKIRHYVGQGQVRAEITDLLDVERILSQIAPGVRDLLGDAAQSVLDDAIRRWPVATGASKAGLYGGTQITPGATSIRGFVANSVQHARYVKSFKNGLGGRSAMVELLRRPVEARAKMVAELAAPLIAKGATSG